VGQEIRRTPFLEEWLSEGLINVSALARRIRGSVAAAAGRQVGESAIVMAIHRMSPRPNRGEEKRLTDYLSRLGDISVRSGVKVYTFVQSGTLTKAQANLLRRADGLAKSFLSIARGVAETTILVDSRLEPAIEELFHGEQCLERVDGLSVLTFLLPPGNHFLVGFYYFILRGFAWSGINLVEIVSTSNEFTLVVSTRDLDAAFRLLTDLRRG